MENSSFFTGRLLIAMPSLQDPNFNHSVTFICEHNENGAIGIIINHPLGLFLDQVFEQMNITAKNNSANRKPVLFGGPVQTDRGFVLHKTDKDWRSTIEIEDGISITTSQDILQAVADGEGPDDILVALGYAGWGGSQLENEVAENTWLLAPPSKEILFDLPFEKRWQAAAQLIGVDLNTLSEGVGHA